MTDRVTRDELQDEGASASAETGSREPSPAVSALTGFDPARDGFPLSRLLMVASNLAVQTTKKVAEISYGSWNPDCMAQDAAEEALNLFASLKRHIEFYERQAAIAMEARQGPDAEQLDGEAATARAGTASPGVRNDG